MGRINDKGGLVADHVISTPQRVGQGDPDTRNFGDCDCVRRRDHRTLALGVQTERKTGSRILN